VGQIDRVLVKLAAAVQPRASDRLVNRRCPAGFPEAKTAKNCSQQLAHAIIAHVAVHGFCDWPALKLGALTAFRNGVNRT